MFKIALGDTYGLRSELDSLSRWRDRMLGYHDYVTVAQVLAPLGVWVEIGAGSGALTAEIRRLGGRCVGTDLHEWFLFDPAPSKYVSMGTRWDKSNTIRAEAERVGRLVGRYPSIGLISAWPSYDEDWCYRAVRHLSVGQLFAYVGEGAGGCTGDDQLHDLLDKQFEVVAEVDLDQAQGIHDYLAVYRRVQLMLEDHSGG